jgi:fatty acid-binding protein DegV
MMAKKVETSAGHLGKIKIAYVHAAALEEAEKIRDIVEERMTVVETIFAELSPALGVHTGPGTAGLCYFPISD